jgi:protein-disulfide isomerase
VAKNVRKKSNSRFVGAIVAIAVVGVAVLGYSMSRPRAGVKPVDPNLIASTAEPYVFGKADAPVTLIEFADFECPACARWSQVTEADVRDRLVNTGLVQFKIYDFPLDGHLNAWPAHNAVACGADQGKFDDMHNAVFASQMEWSDLNGVMNPAPGLRKAAQSVGLDMSAWDTCFDSQKHYPRIKANQAEGIKLGVSQTPSFVIGNKLYPGGMPYDEIKKLVDEALAAAAAASKGGKAPAKSN